MSATPSLQTRLRQVAQLASEARRLGLALPSLQEDADHIEVAVVGEVKRGKSTFLNALMRAKVFPSRVTVCTAAVTILADGEEKRVIARYLPNAGGRVDERKVGPAEDVFAVLTSIVSVKGNPSARDIAEVEVTFPNRYATDGVRLVDTPGVNDPESWREEITYKYLGRADAAIMLLDPQQPLSKSEVEFLRDKVQARVKHQLLFVVNKADQVKPAELEKSLARIRSELRAFVPNPRVFPVAAREALESQEKGRPVPEVFAHFEQELDRFLSRGRAGSLLASRVEAIVDGVSRALSALHDRQLTLAQADDTARAALDQTEELLDRKKRELAAFEQQVLGWIQLQREPLARRLHATVATVRDSVRSNPHGVASQLSQLRRDVIQALEDAVAATLAALHDRFATQLRTEVGALGFDPAAVQFHGLQIGEFQHERGESGAAGGWGAGAGAAAGMMLGGPIGALIGGLAGFFFGNQADERRRELEEARLAASISSYLQRLDNELASQADDVVAGVTRYALPLLRAPWLEAIESQRTRVLASRRDLSRGAAEREPLRTSLQTEATRLEAFKSRLVAFREQLNDRP